MEDRTFDSLAKALAQGRSRRSLLKGMLGLGGAAAVGDVAGVRMQTPPGVATRAQFPKPTVVPGPPTCNDQNCYGCRECVNGVCTANPKDNCYDHTDECLASVCNPTADAAIRLPLRRVRLDADQRLVDPCIAACSYPFQICRGRS